MATEIITLDGARMVLMQPESKKGGKGLPQYFPQQNQGITSIQQPTELGESLKELNMDEVNPNTRMTDMDMRARLHHVELSSVLALDALVALRICPTSCLSITRQKKRLSVSKDGKGRQEIVDIVAGKRQGDQASSGGGLIAAIKDRFSGGKK